MIWGSGGSKSRLAKAAGAEPAGQMRDEKLHAVVAQSTFPSQNVQSTSAPDRFWKLRCRKSARHCAARKLPRGALGMDALTTEGYAGKRPAGHFKHFRHVRG